MLDKVSQFCGEIGLKVSQEKTKVTNIRTDRVLFLGVNMMRSATEKRNTGRGGRTKRASKQLRFTAPLDRVRKKLTESGFIKGNTSHERSI